MKNKLLYVTDLIDWDLSSNILERFIPFEKERLAEIIVMSPVSPRELIDTISGTSITFKEEISKTLSAERIVDFAVGEGVSCMALRLDGESYESLCSEVTKKTSIPVLVMNGDVSQRRLMEHVIFLTDRNLVAQGALEYILRYRNVIDELEIIHVINQKLTVKDMRELKDRLQVTRNVFLDAGIDAESHLYAGKEGEEILTASRDYRGTIIILGEEPRRSFIKGLFKKSFVSEVMSDANIPVGFIPNKTKG